MEYIFNIFGSKNSLDCDVMVCIDKKLDKLSLVLLSKKLEEDLKKEIKTDKVLNVNFCVVNKETKNIEWVFKGTPDEDNNSVFHTFHLHQNLQKYECFVGSPVVRDIPKKIVRCLRSTISLLSKSDIRIDIKKALSTDILKERLNFLKTLKFEDMTFKKYRQRDSLENIFKNIAFQLGQTMSLIKGKEIYTKEELVEDYENLKIFLLRKPFTKKDLEGLTLFKDELVNLIHHMVEKNPLLENMAENINKK